MTHAEKAAALFREGYNCAQSVFLAFEDMYEIDHKTAVRLSSGFGAGMGLPNMKKYTDEMEVETHLGVGTKITMVVNI